jgi:hypothetical protein
MSEGNAAECMVTYDAPALNLESKGRKLMLRLKTVPWTRVIVDALLVLGIVLASSSFLSVR